MHIRRYFLETIRENIKSIPGFACVWIQRLGPTRNSFPCVTLYAESETVQTLTVHPQPRPQDRVITVSINVWVRGTPDDEKAEADMDTFAVLIESAMINNMDADDVLLIATDFKVDEEEPEIHLCTLTYQISYNSVEFAATI